MLLASEQVWTDADAVIASRLASAFSHAVALLSVEPAAFNRLRKGFAAYRTYLLAGTAALIALMALPVQMKALAPMEITPAKPFVIAAPVEGVIADVPIAPNQRVRAGQTIVSFEDTELRNQLEFAERELLVAEAREKKARQLAFDDNQGRHDLGLTIAEYQLKTAELAYARDKFNQATVKAPRDGVAIFSDRQELLGKPMTLGERIMLIADPANVEVTIDVAVQDSIVLQPGADVKIYLDSDPTSARHGIIMSADYQARTLPVNTTAYRVTARLTGIDEATPRLGARGTAQLYGEDVPLAFYLFRRPLSALRQWVGI